MKNLPYPVKLVGALIFVIVLGLVIYIGAAVQVYILAWVIGLIGSILG
jgi:hypothetical protein